MGEHGAGRDVPPARATENLAAQSRGRLKAQPGDDATPRDHRETAVNYVGELFRLGCYRVVICRDGLQWLFQRLRPTKSAGGAAWDTLGYCATREGLMRLHRAHIGPDAPEIAALPAHLERSSLRTKPEIAIDGAK